MLNLYTSAQIEQFKRDAKRTARDNLISHARALDQIANKVGYLNWSLLVKHSVNCQMGSMSINLEKSPQFFSRTVEIMRQAMLKTTPLEGSGSSQDPLRKQIEDLSIKFTSAACALDFAISYMECALKVSRFSINSQSLAYFEMRCWLPYCAHLVKPNSYILLGRDYKPVGMMQKKNHVDYLGFPQVHLHLTEQQWREQLTVHREDAAEGYFYDCSPWTSRKHAETYLYGLREFRNFIS
jgi:hypothetical protein